MTPPQHKKAAQITPQKTNTSSAFDLRSDVVPIRPVTQPTSSAHPRPARPPTAGPAEPMPVERNDSAWAMTRDGTITAYGPVPRPRSKPTKFEAMDMTITWLSIIWTASRKSQG